MAGAVCALSKKDKHKLIDGYVTDGLLERWATFFHSNKLLYDYYIFLCFMKFQLYHPIKIVTRLFHFNYIGKVTIGLLSIFNMHEWIFAVLIIFYGKKITCIGHIKTF